MKKGDYIEVKSGEYRWSQIGSLGKVVCREGFRVTVKFDYLVGGKSDFDLALTDGKFDLHRDDLTKIPKAIYDIKLKGVISGYTLQR